MSEPVRGSPLLPRAAVAAAALLVAAAAPTARKIGGGKLTRVSDVERWCGKWAAPYAAASKSFEEHCRRLPAARAATECADPPGEPECGDADLVAGPASMPAPPPPWRDVRIIYTKAGVYRRSTCHLALETDAGTFLRLGAAGCGADPEAGGVWELDSGGFEAVAHAPGGPPMIVWRFTATAVDEKRVTALLLCGMGRSKRPTCDSVALDKSLWDSKAKAWMLAWRLVPRFDGAVLHLDPDPAAPALPSEEAHRAGAYTLSFP